jgi:hypothetical protein
VESLQFVVAAGCGDAPLTSTPHRYTTVDELARAVSKATEAKKSAELTLEDDGQRLGTGMLQIGPSGGVADATVSVQGQELRLVVTDNAAYVKLPEPLAARLGKPWSVLNSDNGDSMSALLAAPQELLEDGNHIGRSLTTLNDGNATLGQVTTKRLNNVVLTRYVINTAEPLLTILIDQDDLPWQLTTGAGDLHYSSWGTPVDLKPPPADQVGMLPKGQ